MKNKGFNIIFILSIIIAIADLISTLMNGELIQYLESNPLYSFGGLPIIILANILFFVFLYWWYNKTDNPTSRFMVIFILTTTFLIRIPIIYQNFSVYKDYVAQPTLVLETAKTVTKAAKMEYAIQTAKTSISPFIYTFFTWLFFEWDHKIEPRDKNARKRKKNK